MSETEYILNFVEKPRGKKITWKTKKLKQM